MVITCTSSVDPTNRVRQPGLAWMFCCGPKVALIREVWEKSAQVIVPKVKSVWSKFAPMNVVWTRAVVKSAGPLAIVLGLRSAPV